MTAVGNTVLLLHMQRYFVVTEFTWNDRSVTDLNMNEVMLVRRSFS